MNEAIVMQAVAGAGKTYWLVQRYLELVLDQDPGVAAGAGAEQSADGAGRGLRPANIPVITFTEAAGRELVDRVRSALEAVAAGTRAVPNPDGGNDITRPSADDEADAARRALEELSAAPIGTIHSFARRLLMEHAVVADLPYGAGVVDEVSPGQRQRMAKVARRRFWELDKPRPLPRELRSRGKEGTRPTYLDSQAEDLLGDVTPALLRAPALMRARAAEGADALSDLAKTAPDSLDEAWRALQACASPSPGELTASQMIDLVGDVREGLAAGAQCGRRKPAEDCKARLEPVATYLQELAQQGPDEPALVRRKLPNGGRGLNWTTKPVESAVDQATLDAIQRIHDHADAADERIAGARAAWSWVAGWLAVASFFEVRAGEKSEDVLQDELLLKSLALVLRDKGTAEALQRRYPVVLLDEAQDVDATQMELLLELVGGTRMTVVGDPQQSIYGFRGADVNTFDALAGKLDAALEPNTASRRCHPVVVEAVNAAFDGITTFTQLRPVREDDPRRGTALVLDPVAESVTAPNGRDRGPSAADYRIAQADAMADAVVEFLAPAEADAEARMVSEKDGRWRPAEPRDIAILVPSRRYVRSLEKALRRRRVPVNVRPSRELARHPAVEGLAAALFAIADTANTRALLFALRSPLFACTDADITAYVFAAGGRLRLGLDVPEGDPREGGQVAAALAELRRAREVMVRSGAAVALDALVDSTALAAGLAAADGDGWSEGWTQVRRLRAAVAERERTTTESTASLLAWLAEQLERAGNTNATVLHEPHAQAVTLTTIHQAKGLEWPVVLVAALSNDNVKPPKLAFRDGNLEVHISKDFTTMEVEERHPDEAEILRLLYVAMTRARDHVVVSRIASNTASMHGPLRQGALAEAFAESGDERLSARSVPVRIGHQHEAAPVAYSRSASAEAERIDVEQRLAEVAAGSGRVLRRESPSSAGHASQAAPTRNSAAAIEHLQPGDGGQAPEAASGQAPVRPASYAGSSSSAAAAVGTFVHEVLAEVDLAEFTDSTLEFDAVAGDALRRTLATIGDEGVDLPLVRTMLGHARGSEVLARAGRSARVRAEVPVSGSHIEREDPAGPDVEVVTTGSIDLLFDDAASRGGAAADASPDGRSDAADSAPRWILVDHKTDTTGKPQEEFVAGYAPQLAAYEALLAELGVEVSEKWLVRITPHGATDVRVG